MAVPHRVYPVSFDSHPGCYHLLAIGKSTPVNMGVQISKSLLSMLLALYPNMGLLDHMVVLLLIF